VDRSKQETPSEYLRGLANIQELIGEDETPAQLRRCADFMDNQAAMLVELEHAELDPYLDIMVCPKCQLPHNKPHADDCELATLLKQAKGE